MPHASCAHCQAPIVDHSTMVERQGQTFCCGNCAQMAGGASHQGSSGATCAHCNMPIVDDSTQVEREGKTFCCPNCAAAVAGGAGQQRRGGYS